MLTYSLARSAESSSYLRMSDMRESIDIQIVFYLAPDRHSHNLK